jgi:hypothetical protein
MDKRTRFAHRLHAISKRIDALQERAPGVDLTKLKTSFAKTRVLYTTTYGEKPLPALIAADDPLF